MKISEFRKLIREEVRKIIKEATKTSSNPSEIKDYLDYVDNNYKSKSEMNEGTYLMSNPDTKAKVEMIISTLKDIDVDGETMEYILDEVGMSDQIASQLGDKVDDDGFPSMDGGRP